MTKIYVWPDASWVDSDDYCEQDWGHKGDDYLVIDLQEIVDGRTALVYTGSHVELVLKGRQSELLQAELQLKATSSMFRNYRNTMREHLSRLHAEQSSAIARLSAEQAEILANKEQEIKTILTARDQWVKELQGKLTEATRMLDQAEEWNKELENKLRTREIGMLQAGAANSELAESNRKLRAELAVAKDKTAEAELAKALEISDTMEDQTERMRIQLNAAEDKATVCAKERDECAAKVDALESLLSELYQVLGALDAPVKVLDLVTKVLDGHGFDPETDTLLPFTEERDSDEEWSKVMQIWVDRAESAEAVLAKLKSTSAIEDNLRKAAVADLQFQVAEAKAEVAKLKENAALYGEIERGIRQERDRLQDLLNKHGICAECGEMFKRHRDELLASCGCQTVEWAHDFTPYMSVQRALAESRDVEHSQAERADDAEQRAQDLRNELQAMKHEVAGVISRLQEIE